MSGTNGCFSGTSSEGTGTSISIVLKVIRSKVVRYPDFQLPVYRLENITIFDIIVNFDPLPEVP